MLAKYRSTPSVFSLNLCELHFFISRRLKHRKFSKSLFNNYYYIQYVIRNPINTLSSLPLPSRTWAGSEKRSTHCYFKKILYPWSWKQYGPYVPTSTKFWSRINVISRLNICKMVRNTDLKSRSISFFAPSKSCHISFILI